MSANEEEAVDTKPDDQLTVADLRMKKSRRKSVFTRQRNKLSNALCDSTSDNELVSELLDKVETAMDSYRESIEKLIDNYKQNGETQEMKVYLEELDAMDAQYDQIQKAWHEWQLETQSVCSGKESVKGESNHQSGKAGLGKDLFKQLQRVSIPVFSGDIKMYESWKSAFMSCIDAAPATEEYKLLQLRQYLKGPALATIAELSHSAEAYKLAKEKLERKYGGVRRRIGKYIEEIEKYPPVTMKNVKNLEKFSDLLEMTVLNMKETGVESELGHGMLYLMLQRKLPPEMLASYHRWVHDNSKLESVESLKDFVVMETEYHVTASETINGLVGPVKSEKSFTVQHDNVNSNNMKPRYCPFCSKKHGIWDCTEFRELDIKSRWSFAKQKQLCFRCLKENHQGNQCRNFRKCSINGCIKNHHKLLHMDELNPSAPAFDPGNSQPSTYTSSHNSYIALRTVPVIIKANGKELKVNALLDDGSTKTYLNRNVVEELGIQGEIEQLNVNTINGKCEQFETMNISFELISVNKQTKVNVTAYTIENVTGVLKPIDWNIMSKKWPHLCDIKFPHIGRKTKVDLLIGLDYLYLHQSLAELTGRPGSPSARLTPLGWTCVGPCESIGEHEQKNLFAFHVTACEPDINETLRSFWEIEKVERPENNVCKDEIVKKLERETVYDAVAQRYSVPIPWNENKHELKNNFEQAKQRLVNTERKLEKSPEVQKTYAELIKKQVKKGYVRKICEGETDVNCWYMPHFPIVKPKKTTTQVRMVFDASAKHKGISLNDCIHQGPKLQNDIFDVLLRFRKNEVAIMCDIQEMYLQIGLLVPDRPYHRFLWREDLTTDPDIYEFERVVFGVNASPLLAHFVSQENARRFETEFPLAAQSVMKSTYMDDTIDSVADVETGKLLYFELRELWKKASMNPRKWMSNSSELMKHIPEELRAIQEVEISDKSVPETKTLGITWNPDEDSFTFKHSYNEHLKMTKRNVLRTIASLFDPLGFIQPFIVRAKTLMQEIWLTGSDWDEELPVQLARKIQIWYEELSQLNEIRVARCIHASNQSQIHTFVDASKDAYAAVVYCRNNKKIKIITSKTKVAPLKTVSIPRLELLAAVLGLNLTQSVCRSLEMNLKDCTFWSDSLNVLYWIHGQSRQYKPFVANRVGSIHESTVPTQWRYVPSSMNPADLASRGMSISTLSKSDLWWHGPLFLQEEPENWPRNLVEAGEDAKIEVKRKSLESTYLNATCPDEKFKLDASQYSDWNRFIRIAAWVYRFIDNCQVKQEDRRLSLDLRCEELLSAEKQVIALYQKQAFRDEYVALKKGQRIPRNSKLAPLNPEIDSDGVLRCNSRLGFTKFLPFESRFPILLPRKHDVTRLIVKHYHEKVYHGGTNRTLAELSGKYWIISAREAIREIENMCARCKLNKAKPLSQIMGALPDERTQSVRAFATTSVDFAGPFITKQGRGKTRLKRYLCVFTCMVTRAVHFEVTYSLDTNSFLNALCRYVNRRGKPDLIMSDNGTNFVGAVNELKVLFSNIKDKVVQRYAVNERIEWKFMPPNSPHFGGVHESMVKSAKKAIYTVLGNADISDEELLTAVSGAESLINSRPLTYQSANASDDIVLTPNHFLIGVLGGQFAPKVLDSKPINLKRRWRYVQELLQHFWRRWLKEYIPTLGSRSKWRTIGRDVKINDIVLLVDQDTPRGRWPLGRVTKVYNGPDGHVRIVDIRVGNNVYQRPITRLCVVVEAK